MSSAFDYSDGLLFLSPDRRGSSKAQSSIRSQPSNTLSMSKTIQQHNFGSLSWHN
ncbi:unnamed protein product [Arabidopsis lyrata]|uniref:Predicted protein n=1 Tax=Arabidopsis lyrata subsp. lyrata TaxID=81972 RepID=D7KBD6_ARALL|nr:predicted protein [Arabidopsis lyrata subsp. lyrata]CAH8250964.1 unnamed protein product [Arabidopsis lyrata]